MPGACDEQQTVRLESVEQRFIIFFFFFHSYVCSSNKKFNISVVGDRFVSKNLTCGSAVNSDIVPVFKNSRYLIKIMGGQESEKFRWPWQVAVLNGLKVREHYRRINTADVRRVLLLMLYYVLSGADLWRYYYCSRLDIDSRTLF